MKKILEIYSKGLFSTLDESLCQEVLVLFGDLGSSNYETNLKSFFKNKTIDKNEKLRVLLELFAGNQALEAFAKTLSNNNRFELVPDIFNHFIGYAQKKQNNIPVKVAVNQNPSEEIKSRVEEFVKNNIGTSTPIKYEIRKNIMGGIILKYKDNEIDLSLDNRYNELKTMLAT